MFNSANVDKDLREFEKFSFVRGSFQKILLFVVQFQLAEIVVDFLCKGWAMKNTSWSLPEERDDRHFFGFERIICHPKVVSLKSK